jgi:hypothetical protein
MSEKRFIVEDKDGVWQASYNSLLGDKKAKTSARETAFQINGIVKVEIDGKTNILYDYSK